LGAVWCPGTAHSFPEAEPSGEASPSGMVAALTAEAEFITEAWEHFVRLTDLEPEPSLGRVLTALLKPKPVWTHRPEPDFRMLSMGSPRIRRMAETVPA
jgi:hypothetical protein